MPRRIIEDEFTAIETFDQDTSPDDLPEWAQSSFGGFEYVVQDVERFWLANAERHPSAGPHWGEATGVRRADYARRILWGIKILRRMIEKDPNAERAILLALAVGRDIEHTQWRFNRGEFTKAGQRRRTAQRQAGRQSGRVRRAKTHEPVARVAKKIRSTHPHTQQHSTNWLAQRVTKQLQREENAQKDPALKKQWSVHTVRRTLNALGLK